MKENYHKFYTNHLCRDFEMLVFGHSGYPVILFPTSHGRYYENKDQGLINSASHLIDSGKIKIYCPDGIDDESWYNNSIHPSDRVKTHIAYEQVILKDVIEFAKYETGKKKVGIAGCSLGGYHALNLAFRHPEKISHLISLCGSFDIKEHLHGYYDDDCYFNNPVDYLPNLEDEWYLERMRKMQIILATGEWDFTLEENKKMNQLLLSKNVENKLVVKAHAGHDWHYWNEMFPEYLLEMFGDK